MCVCGGIMVMGLEDGGGGGGVGVGYMRIERKAHVTRPQVYSSNE